MTEPIKRTKPRAKTKMFSMKCDEYLLQAFQDTCAEKDIPASQAIRHFMRDFVAKNRQGELKL